MGMVGVGFEIGQIRLRHLVTDHRTPIEKWTTGGTDDRVSSGVRAFIHYGESQPTLASRRDGMNCRSV
jgi:hypothetical protein